jgi:BirA family biotin operon repressor/biotin-[acetyl-CoA-carboxylase] ligase
MNETRHRILAAIDDDTVSGPQLASELEVSRSAVWKHVEALREDGFSIDSDDSGYRLLNVPEFGGPAIEYGLDAPFDVAYHESIPSTNARARELAADGQTDIAVVADQQTGGRGRLDRSWASPSGGIWLSVLFRPDVPMAETPVFTLAAAVAVARAAREAGVEAVIKWPNDVLVHVDGTERKLVGILTEMEGEADRVSWVIIGIGINANVDPAELPDEANPTSLSAIRGEPVNRRLFTQRVLESLDTVGDNPETILSEWREYAATLGRDVRIDTPNGIVTGEAVDIEYPGTLIVDTGHEQVSVAAGDCEHLRPL